MSDELLRRLFAAIDAKDAQAFVACITENGTFRFGSAPRVVGRPAIASAVAEFFETLARLEHRLLQTIVAEDVIVCEGEVTYTRLDGRNVTLPFANILRMRNDLIDDYRVFADISPLYAD